MLFLHQTYQGFAHLPEVGDALVAANLPPPGVIVDYDVRDQGHVESAAASAAPLTPLIADPGVVRFARSLIGRRPPASWVRRSEPGTRPEWTQMADEALAAQRNLNPEYLVTPGVEVHGGQGVGQLERSVATARLSFSARRSTDPAWLTRICVHATRDSARTSLMN